MSPHLLGLLVAGETTRILLSYRAFHSSAVVSPTLLALLVELAKLVVACGMLVKVSERLPQLAVHQPDDSLMRRGLAYFAFFVPALLYLVNNILYFLGLSIGAPALLQAFVMSKLPLTAIVHHFAIRPQEDPHAWLSLCIIALGLAATAVPSVRHAFEHGGESAAFATIRTPLLGIVIGFNSATASIWTEKLLKRDVQFWVAQFYLYFFGLLLAAPLALVWDGRLRSHVETLPADTLQIETLAYYVALVAITAGVGFVIATILRKRDNLVKLVGSSACIVTVFVAQACLFPALRENALDPNSVFGIGLLAIGTYAFNHFKSSGEQATEKSGEGYVSLPTEDASQDVELSPLQCDDARPPPVTETSAADVWRRAWSPFFAPIVALGLVTTMLAIFHPNLSPAHDHTITYPSITALALARPPAITSEHVSYKTDIGSEVVFHHVRWPAESPQGAGELEVLTTRRFCFEGVTEGLATGQMWLLGSEDIPDLNTTRRDIANIVKLMFFHGDKIRRRIGVLNLANYPGPVTWFNGTTHLAIKGELGNHPASWMHVQAAFVSLVTNAYDLLERIGVSPDHWFDRFQLIEESYMPNSWTLFLAEASRLAARASLPGGRYGSAFYPDSPAALSESSLSRRASAPVWHDASDFTGPGKEGLYCFESTVTIRALKTYFRDKADAELALGLLGDTVPRKTPCNVADLQVVFLDRNRPVFNLDRLLDIVREAGATPQVRVINASVPHDQQVRNFHGTDILFSVHGSHLNNQLFMEPNTTLIEMFPHYFRHDEQWRLSRQTGINHIELFHNPYPEESEVEAIGGSKLIKHLNQCKAWAAEAKSFEDCVIVVYDPDVRLSRP
ncbi:uncharacterized protein JCM10292_007073 [Rhodotorula paludigena]|uniref:uncharacterized protein n=1 Tax=Rhodotorula paludigena TaxID=86838 RepID=UPI003179E442